MVRRLFTFVFFLVLLFVAYFVGAGIKEAMIRQKPVPENNVGVVSHVSAQGEPQALPGFCCARWGTDCVPSHDPLTCLRGGGKTFHMNQGRCSQLCHSVQG